MNDRARTPLANCFFEKDGVSQGHSNAEEAKPGIVQERRHPNPKGTVLQVNEIWKGYLKIRVAPLHGAVKTVTRRTASSQFAVSSRAVREALIPNRPSPCTVDDELLACLHS